MKTLLFLTVFWQFSVAAATFTDGAHGFSFEYDSALWEVVPPAAKPSGRDADVDKAMNQKTLVTLQRKVADEKYRSRFSVVADVTQMPFEKYQTYAVNFLKSQRFTIQRQEKRKLAKVGEAYEVVAYQRDFGLTFQQVMIPRAKEVFLITLATRTKQFPNYSAEMDKMLASLRFGTTLSLVHSR